MTMPTDIGVIDLMLDFPSPDQSNWYEFLKPQLRDESKDYEFPAEYMFKDVPHVEDVPDPVGATLALMDHPGIARFLDFARGCQHAFAIQNRRDLRFTQGVAFNGQ